MDGLETIINELSLVAELFYQENLKNAYAGLVAALPKLEKELQEIEDDDARQEVTDKLNLTLQAMEDNDSILIADTIQYELIEALQQLI
ncbi:MAG: hypothetical protein K6G76_07405 [Lachnospiraceae bacterium]|nr:hypothetical protein [Lachnospiraceae bacterium]